MAEVFKLVSLNVKGISNFKKRRTMFTWCRKRKADIIFLQETHSIEKTHTQWKNEWGAEIITSHGSSNARGVAILIKNGFDCTIHQKILDPLGRFIIGRFYARDVKVVKTHLTSETLKRSGIKTGRIKVDKLTDKNKIFLKKMARLYYRKTLGTSKLGTK